MPYGARARKQSEILQLQQEIFDEVQGDTTHLARAVFGDVDDQPDLGRVSSARLDDIYRHAFERNDRQFLQREARRDPEQFLNVSERIGARVPTPQPAPPQMLQPMPPQLPVPPQLPLMAPPPQQLPPPISPAVPMPQPPLVA